VHLPHSAIFPARCALKSIVIERETHKALDLERCRLGCLVELVYASKHMVAAAREAVALLVAVRVVAAVRAAVTVTAVAAVRAAVTVTAGLAVAAVKAEVAAGVVAMLLLLLLAAELRAIHLMATVLLALLKMLAVPGALIRSPLVAAASSPREALLSIGRQSTASRGGGRWWRLASTLTRQASRRTDPSLESNARHRYHRRCQPHQALLGRSGPTSLICLTCMRYRPVRASADL